MLSSRVVVLVAMFFVSFVERSWSAAILKPFFIEEDSPVVEFEGMAFSPIARPAVVDASTPAWVIFVYSATCPHCKTIAPSIKDAARAYEHQPSVRFGAINGANMQNRIWLLHYQVAAYPRIVVLKPQANDDGEWFIKDITIFPIGDLMADLANLVPLTELATKPSETTDDGGSDSLVPDDLLPVVPKHVNWPTVVDPSSAVSDAVLYLAIMVNTEIFRDSMTVELDPIRTLLKLCLNSIPDSTLVAECTTLLGFVDKFPIPVMIFPIWSQVLELSTKLNSETVIESTFKTCSTATCGFWRLLHLFTLGHGETSKMKPSEAMAGIRMIADEFFSCDHCRGHFLEGFDSCACERCAVPPEQLTWKHVAIWLWKFHNTVTTRVEELPEPLQWPSREACPECFDKDNTYNEDQVYQFLKNSYGFGVTPQGVVERDTTDMAEFTVKSDTDISESTDDEIVERSEERFKENVRTGNKNKVAFITSSDTPLPGGAFEMGNPNEASKERSQEGFKSTGDKSEQVTKADQSKSTAHTAQALIVLLLGAFVFQSAL